MRWAPYSDKLVKSALQRLYQFVHLQHCDGPELFSNVQSALPFLCSMCAGISCLPKWVFGSPLSEWQPPGCSPTLGLPTEELIRTLLGKVSTQPEQLHWLFWPREAECPCVNHLRTRKPGRNNPPMYQEAAVGFSEPGLVKEAREGKAEVVMQWCLLCYFTHL